MLTNRLLIIMMLGGACRAAEPDKIRAVLAAMNQARVQHDAMAFAQLFTPDGEWRVGGEIVATGPAAIESALKHPEIWSEVTEPRMERESVRILSRNVALVDAVQIQYGSLILKQSMAVTVLLKRAGGKWKVYSLRETRPFSAIGQFPTF